MNCSSLSEEESPPGDSASSGSDSYVALYFTNLGGRASPAAFETVVSPALVVSTALGQEGPASPEDPSTLDSVVALCDPTRPSFTSRLFDCCSGGIGRVSPGQEDPASPEDTHYRNTYHEYVLKIRESSFVHNHALKRTENRRADDMRLCGEHPPVHHHVVNFSLQLMPPYKKDQCTVSMARRASSGCIPSNASGTELCTPTSAKTRASSPL